MKKDNKDSLNKTYIAVALIIGLAVVGYALINRQTKLDTIREQVNAERETVLKQEEQEAERKGSLDTCLSIAVEKFRSGWMRNCENSGSNIEKDEDGEITSCSLPGYLRDGLEETKQKERDRCAELYK